MYLKNIKQNKKIKYTDNSSEGYNVKKRSVFLSQKKKFARKLEPFSLSHLKGKSISVHLRAGAGHVAITADR